MIEVDNLYELDLHDDFVMNDELDFYQFVDEDLVRSFYLGYNVSKWFDELSKEQKYLYSKQMRHIPLEIKDYINQISFWSEKFFNTDEDEVELIKLYDYILSNIIYTDDTDKVKVAFFLGQTADKHRNEEDKHNN